MFYGHTDDYDPLEHGPFVPRYSVPEGFQRALSYEGQIHWLAQAFDEVWEWVSKARSTWVVATDNAYSADALAALPGTHVVLEPTSGQDLPEVTWADDVVLALVRDTTGNNVALAVCTLDHGSCCTCPQCQKWDATVRYVVRDLIPVIDALRDALNKKISDLDAKVESYNTQVRDLITQLESKVNANDAAVRKLITDLTTKVESYNTALNNRVDALTTTVNANYKTLNDAITALTNTVNANYKTLNDKIDNAVTNLTNLINQATTSATGAATTVNSLVSNVYGATKSSDGTVTLPSGTKIPVANLNWFSATANPTDSTYANAIRSRAVSNNDVKAV